MQIRTSGRCHPQSSTYSWKGRFVLISALSFLVLKNNSIIGDGKTHFIKKIIESSTASTVISINEAFTLLSAIEKLHCLPYKPDCAVHINFLLISTQVSTGIIILS